MTVISKEDFYKSVTNVSCSELLHPWTSSCHKACLDVAIETFKGSIKFYIPIYILKMILNRKKFNKNYLLMQFRYYMRSIAYNTTMVTLFMGTMCTFRYLCGRFYYYNIAFLGGFIGGLSILVESEFNRTLNTIAWTNLGFEILSKHLKKLSNSGNRILFTVCFMSLCSFLIRLMVDHDPSKGFFKLCFFIPSSSDIEQMKINKCLHQNSCIEYIFKGAYQYFLIGYLLQTFKSLLPRLGFLIKKPKNLLNMVLSKDSFLMASFFGSFIGIFRAVNCFYNGKRKPEIAGFLAGISFIFKNDLTVAITSFTTILQYFLYPMSEKLEKKYKIPYRVLLFMFLNGYLIHNRYLHPDICPKYVINMVKTATNGKAEDIFINTLKWSTNEQYRRNYLKFNK